MKAIGLCILLTAAALGIFAQTPAAPAAGAAPAGAAAGRGGRGAAQVPYPMPEPDEFYQLGPDSLPQPGVPKGQIKGPFKLPSQVYPNIEHVYRVYVPASYDPRTPASLMIFTDGQGFLNPELTLRANNVLDNLIWRREIPVMIAVFINPGAAPGTPEPTGMNWGAGSNRGVEYDSLDDKFARVLVDELLPVLYQNYSISKDPDRHGIAGLSSGGIAAFTVAWERPNDFRKVLSMVGSFVNLRGGHAYADLVRKNERKPIRIFMQDGRNDNRAIAVDGTYNEIRDWFGQNVKLMQALTEKGYDVNYTWGIGKHGLFGGPLMPEMMRWLWRDHAFSLDPKDMKERSFAAPAETPAGVPQANR